MTPADGAPPERGGESTYYFCANRNKQSIAVDLKTPEGQEIVRELARCADVLIENMRFGALERMGLGVDALGGANPRLIYCSISGYGRHSSRSADPGYDAVIQAESGLMSITGAPDSKPMKVGVAVTDIVCGMNAAQAILAALLMRERTGKGQFIDIALLDGGLALLANVSTAYLNGDVTPTRMGNSHPTVVPYGIYHGSDGPFVLGCGNDRQFRATCARVPERPDLADDPRFRRNADRHAHRAELETTLAELFVRQPATHWVRVLMAADVPAAEVRTVPQALTAPEVLSRGLVQYIAHPTAGEIRVVASPLRLEGMPTQPAAPPLLGQHTRAVLRETLGKSASEIGRLLAGGIIAGG